MSTLYSIPFRGTSMFLHQPDPGFWRASLPGVGSGASCMSTAVSDAIMAWEKIGSPTTFNFTGFGAFSEITLSHLLSMAEPWEQERLTGVFYKTYRSETAWSGSFYSPDLREEREFRLYAVTEADGKPIDTGVDVQDGGGWSSVSKDDQVEGYRRASIHLLQKLFELDRAGVGLLRSSAGPASTPIEMETPAPAQNERGTTDLEKIRTRLAAGVDPKFTLGEVVRIHDAGQNSIVEFTVPGPDFTVPGPDSRSWYIPYRKGVMLGRSFPGLDAALIYSIANAGHRPPAKADNMAEAACRVLNVNHL